MNTQESITISYLMQGQPLTATQAIRLVLEGVEALGPGYPTTHIVSTLRNCIHRGINSLKEETASLSFHEAVTLVLHSKKDRSPRTIQDFRQCMNKLMHMVPGLAERTLSSLSSSHCRNMLDEAFPSATRRRKAHACLSALFRHGMRMQWCRENPMSLLEQPRVREREILPLRPEELRRLLCTAQRPEHRACLPALGLMLYAGVRPNEAMRLLWDAVDLDEGEITIPPRHSKTGGGRHIPICPALRQLLDGLVPADATCPICPPNWQNRWRNLRREAGFTHWQQDVLRHTFASYYAKAYHDLSSLQLYMGHRDVSLLRTRYVNLHGLGRAEAQRFWHGHQEAPKPYAARRAQKATATAAW